MKIKILSENTKYDLSNTEVMAAFNQKLNSNIDWSFDPITKILNIEADDAVKDLLISEYRDIIEIVPEDSIVLNSLIYDNITIVGE